MVVDTGVLEVAIVLGGQEGLHQHLGQLVIAQRLAALGTKFLHQLAVGGVDPQRHLQCQVFHTRKVGQLGAVIGFECVETTHRTQATQYGQA